MMRSFINDATRIYLAYDATDFRKQISGLSALVSMKFDLDPFDDDYVFLFCNKRKNSLKVLRYDKMGFILAGKTLLDGMKFQWPSRKEDVHEIDRKQVEWLLDGQMYLFEDTEELARKFLEDQEKIVAADKKPHKCTPRKPGVRAQMLEGLPKEIEEYIINAEETCSVCGAPLKVIGKEVIRTEIEFQPAKLIVKQIIRQVAKCTKCGTKNSDQPKDHFQKAAVPAKLLSHTIATPSLVAHILCQKLVLGVPLYRIEKDLFQMGLILPRTVMAHWVIRCSEEWFSLIYWRIHQMLGACEVLHMDETRIQCNKEPDRKASSQSWMWVIQSGACESLQGTFFYYSSSRSGDIPKELLKNFHGYLTTDAYGGYEKEGIIRNLCWSHVRLYFIESIPSDHKGKEIPGSKGARAREYINLLFKLEEEMKALSYEERKNKASDSIPCHT